MSNSATGPVDGFTMKLWQWTTGRACSAQAANSVKEKEAICFIAIYLNLVKEADGFLPQRTQSFFTEDTKTMMLFVLLFVSFV
jgi:hypothetical protein